MAYGNYIATVPLDQVAELRRERNFCLRPTRLAMVSHLLGYWIKAQPIGRVFGQVLDGGERLADHLEHPLRPPMLHVPPDVARLLGAVRDGLEAATAAGQTREIDWFRSDIEKLIAVYELAVDRGEAVVSVLEPPLEESATKVRIPFEIASA